MVFRCQVGQRQGGRGVVGAAEEELLGGQLGRRPGSEGWCGQRQGNGIWKLGFPLLFFKPSFSSATGISRGGNQEKDWAILVVKGCYAGSTARRRGGRRCLASTPAALGARLLRLLQKVAFLDSQRLSAGITVPVWHRAQGPAGQAPQWEEIHRGSPFIVGG